jgi:hypothetical protein
MSIRRARDAVVAALLATTLAAMTLAPAATRRRIAAPTTS